MSVGGYPLSRFWGATPPHLQCAFCRCALRDAVLVTCPGPLDHLQPACRSCIDIHGCCPHDGCGLPVCEEDIDSTESLNDAVLAQLAKCAFNGSGCEAVVDLRRIPEHESTCVHNPARPAPLSISTPKAFKPWPEEVLHMREMAYKKQVQMAQQKQEGLNQLRLLSPLRLEQMLRELAVPVGELESARKRNEVAQATVQAMVAQWEELHAIVNRMKRELIQAEEERERKRKEEFGNRLLRSAIRAVQPLSAGPIRHGSNVEKFDSAMYGSG